MGTLVFGTARGKEIIHQSSYRTITRSNKIDSFHGRQRLPLFVEIFHHYNTNLLVHNFYMNGAMNLHVIPSLAISCILQHAETILMDS